MIDTYIHIYIYKLPFETYLIRITHIMHTRITNMHITHTSCRRALHPHGVDAEGGGLGGGRVRDRNCDRVRGARLVPHQAP